MQELIHSGILMLLIKTKTGITWSPLDIQIRFTRYRGKMAQLSGDLAEDIPISSPIFGSLGSTMRDG